MSDKKPAKRAARFIPTCDADIEPIASYLGIDRDHYNIIKSMKEEDRAKLGNLCIMAQDIQEVLGYLEDVSFSTMNNSFKKNFMESLKALNYNLTVEADHLIKSV